MTPFLNNERRERLVHSLTGLTMPRHYAAQIANTGFAEDQMPEAVEKWLIQRVKHINDWVDSLIKASKEEDGEEVANFTMYIVADMMIMDTFTDECKDRHILNTATMSKLMDALVDATERNRAAKESLEQHLLAKGVDPKSGQPIVRH